MKNSISLSCYLLVLLAILLQGATGNASGQLRQSGEVKLSPEASPQDELEKYWQLQKIYNRPQPAIESGKGLVAVTIDPLAARVGLEALG